MARDDRLTQAADELYVTDPAGFVARRTELARAAKRAGDQPAATAIAALRRPTQSAWTVNRLVRQEPAAVSELADLAKRLRAAERALDGARMRELGRERRFLVDQLARRAFAAADVDPSATLRDEVTATFEAALADTDVAEQVAAGTMLRAVRWSGFGGAAGPTLSVVPQPASRSTGPRPAGRAAARSAASPEQRAADRERDQARQRQVVEARDRLAAAKREQAGQRQRADRLRREVETLRARLDAARAELADADAALRAAEKDRQAADKALGRLPVGSAGR